MNRRPVMTDELSEALRKWNAQHPEDWLPECNELDANLCAAYRNSLDAAEPLKVGQEAVYKGQWPNPRLTLIEPSWFARCSDGSAKHFCAAQLEPAPPELPDDHIDRMWERFAVVRRVEGPGTYWFVVDDASCVPWNDPRSLGEKWLLTETFGETGWERHPDSPIKEKRKL